MSAVEKSSLYSGLEMSLEKNCEESIIKHLKAASAESHSEIQISLIIGLLKSQNDEILRITSQWFAELAKDKDTRDKLTDSEAIELLLQLLNNKDVLCVTQACRALGNLCYDNEKARKFITDTDGLKRIFSVIERSSLSEDFRSTLYLNVICGFLLNYFMNNETVLKEALDLHIIDFIEKIVQDHVKDFSTCEDLFTHLLLLLNLISEQQIDSWFSDKLCMYLVKILELSVNPEISELCLELLQCQADNDDVKLLLAKGQLCELLYGLLEQHKTLVKDEESRALMKLACDLIVLVLTGDESMTFLYDDGKGKVYKDMMSWLESDDVDLLITGVLAIGNFARNDSHCIKMVENGLSKLLLEILKKHNNTDTDVRLQHALLSALRNLVIPAQNKEKMIKDGLVDIVYPMLSIEQYAVIFKLLGTLRMVIDGQEATALDLVNRKDFVEKLVGWCSNSDHPGVCAEAPRLLAWLIKHCHSSAAYPKIIKTKNGTKCLVEMIPSSHAVMQNEALFALNLLSASCLQADLKEDVSTTFIEALCEADVGKCIAFLLNKYCDKIAKEIVENLTVLLESLVVIPQLKENLKKAEVSVALRKCSNRKDLSNLTKRIDRLCCLIDSS